MSKNMIWITGADGHVGTALHKVLPEHGYHVLCTNKEDVDVTDMDAVRLYAEMNRPTVIINCAALTNPSECNWCKKSCDRGRTSGCQAGPDVYG